MQNLEDPNAKDEERILEDGTTLEQFEEFEDQLKKRLDEERKKKNEKIRNCELIYCLYRRLEMSGYVVRHLLNNRFLISHRFINFCFNF